MRKRTAMRYVPGLGRVARALDSVEARRDELGAENQSLRAEVAQLRSVLRELMFTDDAGHVDPAAVTRADAAGLPVPSPILRHLVAGIDELDWFLASGKKGADAVTAAAALGGRPLVAGCRVLDLGVGCGRVVRHLKGTAASLHGCDCNVTAIRWCQTHLPFVATTVNPLAPPLPYPDGSFDVVYAFSVFTHFDAELQEKWAAEVRRVLAPGGVALLSAHGDALLPVLTPAERAAYGAGELVVRAGGASGTNYCAAFHPPAYGRALFGRGFDVVAHQPEGALGNPPQDLYVLRAK